MKITQALSILFLGVTVIFSSCNTGEDDTNAPTIGSFLINGIGSTGTIEVLAGNNIVVTGTISEDIAMDSYRVQVVADFTPATGTPFGYDQSTNSGSLTTTVNETIAVPASAIAGPYKVILTAIDAAGRESEMELVMAITNATQADINVTAPSPNFVISFSDTISLAGTVTDDVDIVSIEIVAEPMQQAGGFVAAGGPFYEGTFNLNGSSDTTWNMSEIETGGAHIVAPATGSTGLYKVELRATDSDGNVTVETIPFNIF